MRHLQRVVTNDEADLRLLERANEKRKFGVAVGLVLPDDLQRALERGMDKEWFTLIDIAVAGDASPQMLRLFRLTDAGMKRLAEVRALAPTN